MSFFNNFFINLTVFLVGSMKNYKNKKIGENISLRNGDILEMEVNLRSDTGRYRTLKYLVNDNEQSIYFYNIPSSVKFAVYIYIYIYI